MTKIIYFLFTKSIGFYLNVLSFLYPKKANRLAFMFFSNPREGKLKKDKLPLILQETKSETYQLDSDYFQTYIWNGNTTKILLAHGWESNAARWENLISHLKKSGSTIIAIDAPAHGLSSGKEFSIPKYAEYINKTIEKHQPQFVIGHSIGGKSCLYSQYIFPNDVVKKMVILGAPCDFKILIKNFVSILSLNSRLANDLEKKYITDFKLQLEDFSAQKFVSNSKIKGLIAHDIEDTVVSINEGKKIAQAWQNSHFITTKGLGHSLHDDKLYQEVYDFLFLK
jgi:pimeloyl-ACP methyl ester carboxylesterase